MSGAILAAAALALLPVAANAADVTPSSTEQAFLSAINKVRGEHGLARVVPRDDLVKAARFHSHDMIEAGYFAHRVFWRRLERFGITHGTVGEVLGWDSHIGIAPRHLVGLWLVSPEHRVVLLNPRYHFVGVGVADGPFQGFPKAIVVTADFWEG
jgi:uncharacterized protein YkwD